MDSLTRDTNRLHLFIIIIIIRLVIMISREETPEMSTVTAPTNQT